MAVQSARDGLVVQNLNGIVLWVNDAYCEIMGRDRSEMIGLNPLRYAIPPEQRPSEEDIQNFRYENENKILKAFDHHGMHLAQNQRKNGELFWMQMTVSHTLERNQEAYVVLVCRDVTKQIANEQELERVSKSLEEMTKRDTLTGLVNRRGLTEFYNTVSGSSKSGDEKIGLLHIDLDRFKEINDLNGHACGDAVLQHVAEKMVGALRSTDVVARAGGDEFVAICTGLDDVHQLDGIATSVANALSIPLAWRGVEISVTASVGAVLTDPKDISLDDVLQQADYALYAVKSKSRNAVQIFDHTFSEEFERQTRRTREIVKAIESKEISFHFQPVLRAATGEIRKFETLARWDHPSLGLLQAEDFLDLAETTGRIVEIDRQAAHAAAKMLATIKEQGHKTMRVGINASTAFLQSGKIVDQLLEILEEFKVPPHRFVVEVPEQTVTSSRQSERQLEVLRELKEAGFLVMIDDFRAGSLALMQLPDLPIDGLKISRSITSELETNPVQQKVLRAVLEVASDLNLQAIIPGIETAARAKLLSSFNGDRVQGNWYAHPMPMDHVLDWIDEHYSGYAASRDIAPAKDHRYLGTNSDL